jgi:tetratricopeptide (TPR) repeat protein
VHVAINLNNIGEIRSDQGRLDEASELLEQARVLWAGAGWRDAAYWAVSNLGRVASRAGRDREAAQRLSEAIDVFVELRVEPLLLQTEAREVERHVLAGRSDAALELIEEMAPRVERAKQASVALMLDRLAGYALAQAGDPERGADRLEASLAACRSSGAEYEAALALEGLSLVAPLVGRDDASELAAEAAAIFERLGVVRTPDVPLGE